MSQYYPPMRPPAYPPPPPPVPQQQPPNNVYEDGDYEYEDEPAGNNIMQLGLSFFAGGCLVFFCFALCGAAGGVLWMLDSGDSGLPFSSATPIPGSDIGLTFDAPALPGEAAVNDQGLQLTILETNRNAVVEGIPPVEGREVVIVTVELINLSVDTVHFNEADFQLLNAYQEAYPPALGAIAGALGRGTLPPNEGLEGRLVFEVIKDEADLRLFWQPGQASAARFLYLQ